MLGDKEKFDLCENSSYATFDGYRLLKAAMDIGTWINCYDMARDLKHRLDSDCFVEIRSILCLSQWDRDDFTKNCR